MDSTPKYYVKSDTHTAVPVTPIVAMNTGDFVRALVAGAGVGLAATGIYLLLNKFIFGAALCRTGVEGCSTAPLYSTIVTVVVAIIIGIIVLAKIGTYRPLLVAIAAPIALWPLFTLLGAMPWYWALLIGMALYAVAFALFAWLARLRSFILSIILLLIAVVIVRVVLG